MLLVLKSGDLTLFPVRATLVRKLGGLSRWELDFHPGGPVSVMNRAAELFVDPFRSASLQITSGASKPISLAEKLHIIGGRPRDTSSVRLIFSEANFEVDQLTAHRRVYSSHTEPSYKTLQAFFETVTPGVVVTEGAATGLYESVFPVLIQNGISQVDLALQIVEGYQQFPGARPLTITGRTTLRIVPVAASDSASVIGDGYELVEIESELAQGYEVNNPHGQAPVVVLERRIPGLTMKSLAKRISEQIIDLESDLPWKAKVAVTGGKPNSKKSTSTLIEGSVVWSRDSFSVTSKTMAWERRAGVRRAESQITRQIPGAQTLTGIIVAAPDDKELQDIAYLKLAGFEAGFDTLPARLVTPYSGIDGKGGLHFRPAIGTRALVIVHPRPDQIPLLIGNVRELEVLFAAPSIVIPGSLTVAGGAETGLALAAQKGLIITECGGSFAVSATSEGITVNTTQHPVAINAQQVSLVSSEPLQINNVQLQFQ